DTLDQDRPPLAGVADTLARRAPLAERLALVAEDTADAVTKLTAAADAVAAGRTGRLGPGQLTGTVPPGAEPEAAVPGSLSAGERPAASAGERSAALARLAERAVTGAGLRPVLEHIPPCTLPPSPLAPRHH
ncbi:beta-ketoacyl synthase, partial [Streptomyces albiflaviniger]|nr:beta-ketoacyl synthase [Streptomyces albiflaviniger]